MPLHPTEAVILRRWRAQEADALYLLFTEVLGKVTAKARGVSKIESRLAGILQPYNRIHVIFYSKLEEQDVLTITQASLIRHHPGVQSDLTKLALAACAAELIDTCTADGEPNPTLWILLTKLLSFWDEHDATQAQLVAFALRVLRVTGFEPHLSSCTECGATERSQWYYSPERGGVVCPSCRRTERLVLSARALDMMSRLESGEKLSLLPHTSADVQEMLMFLDEHIGYHVGQRSRALRFLRQLSGLPSEPPDS